MPASATQADDRAVRPVPGVGHDRGDAGHARAGPLRLSAADFRSGRVVPPCLARRHGAQVASARQRSDGARARFHPDATPPVADVGRRSDQRSHSALSPSRRVGPVRAVDHALRTSHRSVAARLPVRSRCRARHAAACALCVSRWRRTSCVAHPGRTQSLHLGVRRPTRRLLAFRGRHQPRHAGTAGEGRVPLGCDECERVAQQPAAAGRRGSTLIQQAVRSASVEAELLLPR